MKQFPEHRINIFRVANMLHGKVFKGRLQVFILPPQRLVRTTGYLDIAVVADHGQDFLRQQLVTQR